MKKTRDAVEGPAPRSAGEQSSARERTLAYMRRLLATTAVGGAALGGAGCGDPIVCDPLPAPLQCSQDLDSQGMLDFMSASAWWAGGASGLEVELGLDILDPEGKLSFAGDPVIFGATVVGAIERTDTMLHLRLAPEALDTTVDLTVAMGCDGQAAALHLLLPLGESPPVADSVILVRAGE